MWRYSSIQRVTVGIFCSEPHFASRILRRSWISDRIRYCTGCQVKDRILSSQDTRLAVIRTKQKDSVIARQSGSFLLAERGSEVLTPRQSVRPFHPITHITILDTFADSTLRRLQHHTRQHSTQHGAIVESRQVVPHDSDSRSDKSFD